jgi:hypothetical protein
VHDQCKSHGDTHCSMVLVMGEGWIFVEEEKYSTQMAPEPACSELWVSSAVSDGPSI